MQLSPSNQNRTKNMNIKLFVVIMLLYLPKTSVKYIENMFSYFFEKFHSGYYVTKNKGKKDTTSDVVSYPWFFLILFSTTRE